MLSVGLADGAGPKMLAAFDFFAPPAPRSLPVSLLFCDIAPRVSLLFCDTVGGRNISTRELGSTELKKGMAEIIEVKYVVKYVPNGFVSRGSQRPPHYVLSEVRNSEVQATFCMKVF